MPVVTLIGGPNGSGKSTLVALLRNQGADLGEHLNADDIAKTLTGPKDAVSRHAQEEVRRRRARALLEARDHSWETVMSHVSHIEHLRDAKAAGFHVRLIYVATEDPRLNVARVFGRVQQGGHDVPEGRVIDRWRKSLDNLPYAIASCDAARIFDNGLVDIPMRLVMRLDDGILRIAARLPRWTAMCLNRVVEDYVGDDLKLGETALS